MTPEQLARYGALKQRSAPKSAGEAAATPGSIMHTLFGDPRPTYNRNRVNREGQAYKDYVDQKSADRESSTTWLGRGVNSATMGATEKLGAAISAGISALPTLVDDREFRDTFRREYSSNIDAAFKAADEYAEEHPTRALAADLGGALYGGHAAITAGGSALRGLGAATGTRAGADLAARLTNQAAGGVVEKAAKNALLGAGFGAGYAAGYDMDIERNALTGAVLGPVGAAAFKGGSSLARNFPKATAAAAGAGTAYLAGGDEETQGIAALGAGALASRTSRRALGNAMQRLMKGGTNPVAPKPDPKPKGPGPSGAATPEPEPAPKPDQPSGADLDAALNEPSPPPVSGTGSPYVDRFKAAFDSLDEKGFPALRDELLNDPSLSAAERKAIISEITGRPTRVMSYEGAEAIELNSWMRGHLTDRRLFSARANEKRRFSDDTTTRPQANEFTPVSPDDLNAGRRAVADVALETQGRGAAKDALRATGSFVGARGYSPKGNAAVASVVKALGGPRQALARIGQLRTSWDRMSAALDERRAVIGRLTSQLSAAEQRATAEAERASVLARQAKDAEKVRTANSALAQELGAVREEAATLAERMNEARQAMARLQAAVQTEAETNAGLRREIEALRQQRDELLPDAEAGVGMRGSRVPPGDPDAATAAVDEARTTAERVTSLEESFARLENLGGLREQAARAVDAELITPGSISGNRKAATQWAASSPIAQRLNRSGRRAFEAAEPELEAERLFKARRNAAIDLHDEAGRMRDKIDPSAPGAEQLRARLKRIMDDTQRIKEKTYPGAERMTHRDAMRLQDDADTMASSAAGADRIESLRTSLREALDRIGLKDFDGDVVTDEMMRVITGGKSAKGLQQGMRIIINADRYTGNTIGHEGLHGLMEIGVLRPNEYKSLLTGARRVISKADQDELRRRPAYRDLSDEEFDEELAARYVGPQLERIASGEKPARNMAGQIARRIYDIGRGVREALTGADIDPETVVERIASGDVGNRMRRGFGFSGLERGNRKMAGFAAYANPRTAEERARAEAAQEFGIRLSKGQQSGAIGQLQKEDAYAQGAYGDSAQNVMEGFYNRQGEQVGQAIEGVSDRLGVGAPTTDPIDAMVEVVEGVARRDAARRGWANRKYDRLAAASQGIELAEPQDLVRTLRAELDDIIRPENKTIGIVEAFEKEIARRGGKLTLSEFRKLRSKALATARNITGGSTEAREARQITRAMDDWFDNAVERDGAFLMGDGGDAKKFEKTIRMLRDANQYYRKYKEAFDIPPGAGSTEKRARKILMAMADRDIGVNELVRHIFGAGEVGGPELSVRMLSQLERILNYRAQEVKRAGFFTDDYMTRMSGELKPTTLSSAGPKIPSPEWQAIRGATFRMLTQAKPGQAPFTPEKVAKRMNAFLNGSGKGAARILFEPEELQMLRRFTETMRALDRQRGRGNPSGSGYAMYRIGYDLMQRLFGAAVGYGIGEQMGGPGGAMAGAVAGMGTGSMGARMVQNVAGRMAARSATAAQAMPMTAAQEGFQIWGKVRAAMAASQAGARELSVPASK